MYSVRFGLHLIVNRCCFNEINLALRRPLYTIFTTTYFPNRSQNQIISGKIRLFVSTKNKPNEKISHVNLHIAEYQCIRSTHRANHGFCSAG